jgi:acylphosphatase
VSTARVHLVASGRVQGVFYRQSTVDAARRLDLRGWVRNLPDGRVEAEAEGERTALESLVEWCRRGPPGARVLGLEVRWDLPVGDLGPFEVRR